MSCSSISKPDLEENGFSTHHDFLLAYEHEIPPHIASELDSLFLFHSKPVVVLHRDHPLANQPTIDIPMLKNEKLLMPQLGNTLGARLVQLFTLHGLPYPGDNCYSFLARQKNGFGEYWRNVYIANQQSYVCTECSLCSVSGSL